MLYIILSLTILKQLWDIGGQPRFRSMWERYCRGVQAIVFVVDASDVDQLEVSIGLAEGGWSWLKLAGARDRFESSMAGGVGRWRGVVLGRSALNGMFCQQHNRQGGIG